MNQYLLPRNASERRRLNLQHTVITRQFEGCLPSSVPVRPHDMILDMCCGTGAWSIDVASQVSSEVTIHACDISSANFPPDDNPNKIPPNVHFSRHSVLSLPSEWSDSFDIVHQRLVVSGLTKEQWAIGLQELYRVTKPGGHLLLIEINPAGFVDPLASPVPAQKELNSYRKALLEDKGMLADFSAFPEFVQQYGFHIEAVEQRVFSTEGAITSVSMESEGYGTSTATSLEDDTLACMVRVFSSYRPQLLEEKLVSAERFDKLLQEMSIGWKDVVKTENGRGFPWIRIHARKPIASAALD
jgi:ubiquinone/menaquinone biosynthesis C-methylase UbiE